MRRIKGMLMVFIPIGACCSFIRFVVGGLNPLEGVVMVRSSDTRVCILAATRQPSITRARAAACLHTG